MGSDLGIPEDKILALGAPRACSSTSKSALVALRYANAITLSDRDVDEELFERVRGVFDEDALIALTAIIAQKNSSSKFNRALRVPSQGL